MGNTQYRYDCDKQSQQIQYNDDPDGVTVFVRFCLNRRSSLITSHIGQGDLSLLFQTRNIMEEDCAFVPAKQQERHGRGSVLSRIFALLILACVFIAIYILTWEEKVIPVVLPLETVEHPDVAAAAEPPEELAGDDVNDETQLVVVSPSLWCAWDPDTDDPVVDNHHRNSICAGVLSQHMSTSLVRSRQRYLISQQQQQPVQQRLHRRWLYFGDSTMYRMFAFLTQPFLADSVQRFTKDRSMQQCVNYNHCHHRAVSDHNNKSITDFQCTPINTGLCDRMEHFQLPRLPTNDAWQRPNFAMGEGPLVFGLTHPYCTDCQGCESILVSCRFVHDVDTKMDRCTSTMDHNNNNGNVVESYVGPSYGGFLGIEFARDVELQTAQYNTTQENLILQYVATQWNSPIELVLEFGRPICVVTTGHHDVIVPHVTDDVFLQNVQWYLELLLTQCDYIIWISSNAPLTDKYEQKVGRTYEWNMALLDLLHSSENELFQTNVFFLDVFNASIAYEHEDNLHLEVSWYQKLASFFQSVMQNVTL